MPTVKIQPLFPPFKDRQDWPKAWIHFIEEYLPNWTKKNFAPDERWKKNPFSPEDLRFFSRSIVELSEKLTEGREDWLRSGRQARASHSKKSGFKKSTAPSHHYFRQPKFRSAYFLFYLPLQACKFFLLFYTHKNRLTYKVENFLREVTKEKTNRDPLSPSEGLKFRVLDLGSGPGTASFAFRIWIKTHFPKLEPYLEFIWVDQESTVIQDGKKLWKDYFEGDQAPLGMPVSLEEFLTNRTKGQPSAPPSTFHLVLLGNALNETQSTPERVSFFSEKLNQFLASSDLLIVEPAFRTSGLFLSLLRDQIIETSKNTLIVGPCPHEGLCPLTGGRDWCHFSVPAQVPSQWHKQIERGLGSEREWMKFSYLWLANKPSSSSTEAFPYIDRSRASQKSAFVISDAIEGRGSKRRVYLICTPKPKSVERVPPASVDDTESEKPQRSFVGKSVQTIKKIRIEGPPFPVRGEFVDLVSDTSLPKSHLPRPVKSPSAPKFSRGASKKKKSFR